MRARFPLVPVLLGVALALPALWVGLQADDYQLRAAILNEHPFIESGRSRWSPYTWLTGDPEGNYRVVDLGWMPWWTDPQCKASLFRPLTALTLMADFQLWPQWPAIAHLQSLAWYGLAVWAASVLYRRMLGPIAPAWVVGLAALLYAIDDAHAIPAGWIANRNSTIAAFFGFIALILHDRWRREKRTVAAIVGPIALLAAALAKEEGVAVGGYLLAYAVFLDRGSVGRRLTTLWPYLLVGLAWLAMHRGLGFGAYASDAYIDPLHHPVRFLERVVDYGPVLLLGQWGMPPADAANAMHLSAFRAYWAIALLVVVFIAVMLGPILRRYPEARFLALGSLLAILPVCAIFPSNRLLMLPGLGSMGLLALWFERWVCGCPDSLAKRVWVRAGFGRTMVALHLVLAPLMFPPAAFATWFVGWRFDRLAGTLPDDPAIAEQTLVHVTTLSPLAESLLWHHRWAHDRPVPVRSLSLSPACASVELTRLDERTLAVRPSGGYLAPRATLPGVENPPMISITYLTRLLDHILRDPDRPLRLGQQIRLTTADIEITALSSEGLPVEATFRFAVPLDDPSLRWVTTRGFSYVPFEPPAVGQTVRVPNPLD